jgi:hypothetical protein
MDWRRVERKKAKAKTMEEEASAAFLLTLQ